MPRIRTLLEMRSEYIRRLKCVICGEDAREFRDDKSETEYGISAMCQSCQDEFFGGKKDD